MGKCVPTVLTNVSVIPSQIQLGKETHKMGSGEADREGYFGHFLMEVWCT